MEAAVARLESVAARLEAAAAKMGAGEVDEEGTPQYVADYQSIMDVQLAALVKACTGVKVKKCGTTIKKAFTLANNVIAATAKCKKPSADEMKEFFSDPMAALGEVLEGEKRRRDKKKQPDRGNHRGAMFEVGNAAAWVTYAPPGMAAGTFMQSQLESAEFQLNRILKNDKSDEVKAFVKATKDLLNAHKSFIKDNFKTGLVWRGKAALGDAPAAAASAAAPKKAPAKKAPAKKEEKAPEAEEKKADEPAAKKTGGGMGNVMGEISKGLKITAGLKKVKKSQKTKYREKTEGRGKVTMKAKKAAKKKKVGKRMKKLGAIQLFDFGEGVQKVTKEDADMKTQVFCAGCTDCGVEVFGKVKNVVIEGCKNFQISVEDVVSTIEMVNCKSVTLYVKGSAPTVQVDKSESPNIVIMSKTIPKIISSMVTAGNIEIPSPTDADADATVTIPIPEQFVIVPKPDGSCTASPMSH